MTDSLPNRLAVFAKSPAPGAVKTRLIPDLGVSNATAIYRLLLEHVLGVCRGLENVALEIWVRGALDESFFAPYPAQGFQVNAQQGRDLGERMRFAVEQGLGHSARLVIIGSDCAQMTSSYIRQAFGALDSADVVIGPALDGGYVLLGLCRVHNELFDGINWGSERVLRQTLNAARSAGLKVTTLEAQADIDHLDDVLALRWRAPQLWKKLKRLVALAS